jgi:DNA-binding transcriptional LysR family regulator
MKSNRQYIPSTTALRALEAVDRLGSASAAAQEMHLTQSAVSRQLQSLETQLGLLLFDRDGKALRLRPGVQDYVGKIRTALRNIENAGLALAVPHNGGDLQLAILPSFGMRWLVPKLPEFTARHPDVVLNFTTRLRPFDFAAEQFDAAIYYGQGDWPGLSALRLQSEQLTPVCSPELAARFSFQHPKDLLGAPLLRIETRPTAWADWFGALGIPDQPDPGPTFDQYTTILQAALHGLGVALLPDFLADPEISAGRLVRAYGGSARALGAYYLVWQTQHDTPALRKFRNWLAPFCVENEEDRLPR